MAGLRSPALDAVNAAMALRRRGGSLEVGEKKKKKSWKPGAFALYIVGVGNRYCIAAFP
jgi:hypothetical protein